VSALIDDLLELLRKRWPDGQSFTAADLRRYERQILAGHPDIMNGSAAIRATMQRLRDRGLVEFEGGGVYRLKR
jgi:Dam-replacing HTH domain